MTAENYKLQITNYKFQPDQLALAILTTAVSVVAFTYYFRQHTILLYGDAVAHINIARRVFDSLDPGPLQLGTVWLPLPHILILPFVISRRMWQSGVGGSIPSMIAFVAGAVAVFRLMRGALGAAGAAPRAARVIAWFTALIYVANPNLLYLQATAMTEPLYLALFLWAAVFFSEFVWQLPRDKPAAARSLRNCGIALLLCMLTRYDGWFAGAIFGVAAAAVFRRTAPLRKERVSGAFGLSLLPFALAHRELRKLAILLLAVPVLWVVYNAAVWGNPLEFATGQYSAKAIERRSASAGMPHHPGYHSVNVASLYFVKSARLEVGQGRWEAVWIWLAVAGSALGLLMVRRVWPLLLLWLPLPFYAFSISRGGVPIFFPEWWPYSYYNARYGLQLFPALAVFSALAWYFVLERAGRLRWQIAATAAAVALVAASYVSVWQSVPICLREARANSLARVPFERLLAGELERLPQNATLLMYLGEHVGVLQTAGIPLRRTINETTDSFWKDALANPAAYAEYAIAFDDDPVAEAMRRQRSGFETITVVESWGQRRAAIYRRSPPH